MKLLSSFILVSSLAFASPQDYGFIYNLQNNIKGNESVLVDVEINSFTGKVAEVVLPPFVAHTNNQALHLTAEQTQKINDSAAAIQLFGPRISLIEASTNRWQTAYSWGDHALAGYLLPAALAPYATTAALVVHTNRIDNPHNVTAVQIGAITAEVDPVANAALTTHINRTDNPHSVTAVQIGALTAELDPVANAALVVHANRTDNPHNVTAAQIGALTAEADPVAGPRLDLIESATNKWNTAHSWGDHSMAGYLLPADLLPYATVQQVTEAVQQVTEAVSSLNLYAVPVDGGKHELWVKE